MAQTPALKVDANGNVGVSTGTPLAKFHVVDGTANAIIKASSFTGGAATTIDFTGGNDGNFRMGAINTAANSFHGAVFQAFADTDPNFSGQFYFDAGNTAASGLFFRTAQIARMAISAGGNVGIGTSAPTEALEVVGNIKASGTVTSSDKRLKNNIRNFDKGLAEVLSLNPVSFAYNGKGGTNSGENHIGLIAQEIQKVVPEMVESFEHKIIQEATLEEGLKVLGEESYLQIKDSEIKYLLINAVQEQNALIGNQASEIEELRNIISELRKEISQIASIGLNEQNISLEDVATLGQNNPNPFNESTKIPYSIPATSKKASITFFDNTGKILKSVDINQFGKGTIDLSNTGLPAGSYNYSLVVDGKIIESKKMMVVR